MKIELYKRIENLPDKDYFGVDADGSSTLKDFKKSPHHYQYYKKNKKEVTPSILKGSIIHKKMLEPEVFEKEFAIIDPEKSKGRSKAALEYKVQFADDNKDKTIITQEMMDDADTVIEYAKLNNRITNMIKVSNREVAMFVKASDLADNAGDKLIRAKIDIEIMLDDDRVILADLKTTRDPDKSSFFRDAYNLGYHIQAALYTDVYERVTGKKVVEFYFACVQTSAPYGTAIYKVNLDNENDTHFISQGRAEYTELLTRLHQCRLTNTWPSIIGDDGDFSQPIEIPTYFRR